jgi:hypothetical protein
VIQVFVSRHIVEQNDTTGGMDPVFTVVNADGTECWGCKVIFTGEVELKYDRNKPVGRRIWLQTFEKVLVESGAGITSVSPTVVAF